MLQNILHTLQFIQVQTESRRAARFSACPTLTSRDVFFRCSCRATAAALAALYVVLFSVSDVTATGTVRSSFRLWFGADVSELFVAAGLVKHDQHVWAHLFPISARTSACFARLTSPSQLPAVYH